jgi:hypothetical protein
MYTWKTRIASSCLTLPMPNTVILLVIKGWHRLPSSHDKLFGLSFTNQDEDRREHPRLSSPPPSRRLWESLSKLLRGGYSESPGCTTM